MSCTWLCGHSQAFVSVALLCGLPRVHWFGRHMFVLAQWVSGRYMNFPERLGAVLLSMTSLMSLDTSFIP